MLFTVFFFACFAGYLVLAVPASIHIGRLTKKGKLEKKDRLVKNIAVNLVNRLSKLARIKYDVSGSENIPDGPVLYVANHQGFLDMAVMLGKMKEPCAFMAKKEAEKIPLLSTWMKHLGCVFVDRENARAAVKALDEANALVASGKSMVIFPEGTRSKSDNVGEFKNGAFRIAKNTGVPIVPVAIDGSYKAWDEKHRITPTTIRVKILPPFSIENISRAEFKEIGNTVRAIIVKAKDSKD